MNVLDAEVGQTYGPYELKFDNNKIKEYINCVTFLENKELYSEYLPPFFPVALALSELIEDLKLFQLGLEAVHSGQEASWEREISPKMNIFAKGKLSSKKYIRKSLFLVISVEYNDLNNQLIGSSISRIILNEK
ncbi:MAG: hypothetical protein CL748_00945 [Chloroflexi bacterium]|nr:hypothetical protein [Chloroflexota bacterium]